MNNQLENKLENNFEKIKKWATKRLTINLAAVEAKRLEKCCQQTGRPATDVIRELIRNNLSKV